MVLTGTSVHELQLDKGIVNLFVRTNADSKGPPGGRRYALFNHEIDTDSIYDVILTSSCAIGMSYSVILTSL